MKTDDQNEPLEGHDYDGITELDNPAPFWWQLFFYLSIVFGVGYFGYYEILGGPSSKQELNEQIAVVEKLRQSGVSTGPTRVEFETARKDPNELKLGAVAFVQKCASCHAPDGGGGIGPNLTDPYWIYGKGDLMEIYDVVRRGVNDKGMPPWGDILSKSEMLQVVAYVDSLKGTKPKAPKEPQGSPASGGAP